MSGAAAARSLRGREGGSHDRRGLRLGKDKRGGGDCAVAPGKKALFTNNIEAPRLEQEDRLAEQGWEIYSKPWYETSDLMAQHTRGLKVGADAPLTAMEGWPLLEVEYGRRLYQRPAILEIT
jgi:hypothetical protein